MTAAAPYPAVPPAFAPWPAKGPFVETLARLFVAGTPEQPVFGVRVEPAHCNGQGVAHGGFISTLADVWCAYGLVPRLQPTARLVTSHLAVDFLSPARAGDWLQSDIDRVRIGRRLCVVTLAIVCERRPVALAKGSFVLLEETA